MKISDIILGKIKEINGRKPSQKFNWIGSLYEDIHLLTIDERGQVGEEITVDILKSFGCKVQYESSVTKKDKGWDLISNNLKIEVKLATVTVGTGYFQHESMESERNFDAILFIDITPAEVYLTAVLKKDIIWEGMHKRKYGNDVFKCDFSIDHIKNNNLKKFRKYKTGLINSPEDFFNTYKWLEENIIKID